VLLAAMPGLVKAAPGHIDRIEVVNFKSYRGSHVIGPFDKFTAVIGPNGSGKSNLMDAISFVLGVRTSHLRGNLQELLYKYSNSQSSRQSMGDTPSSGSVKLVYVTGEGEEVHFMRTISPPRAGSDTASSQYKINGRTVTHEAYDTRLATFAILVKARNFLVFQGDIESVAQMSPKGLTELFEKVSGSGQLKKEYEERQAAKEAAEEHVAQLAGRKKTVMQEKRQKKEQKQEAERHTKLVEALDDLKVEYFLWQLFHIDQEMRRERRERRQHQQALQHLHQNVAASEAEVKDKKKEQGRFVKQKIILERKIAKERMKVEERNPGKVKRQEEIVRLERSLKKLQRDLADKRKAAGSQADVLAQLEADLLKVKDLQEELEGELAQEAASGGWLSDPSQLDRYAALKLEADAKTSKLASERSTAATKLQAEQIAQQNLQASIRTMEEICSACSR